MGDVCKRGGSIWFTADRDPSGAPNSHRFGGWRSGPFESDIFGLPKEIQFLLRDMNAAALHTRNNFVSVLLII